MDLRREERKALGKVRRAIHGWAFADVKGVRNRLVQAERELEDVPEEFKAQAEELLEPLRRILRLET